MFWGSETTQEVDKEKINRFLKKHVTKTEDEALLPTHFNTKSFVQHHSVDSLDSGDFNSHKNRADTLRCGVV